MHKVALKKPPLRILLVATPGFGDVMLITPLIRSLKRAWPEADIDVMVHAGREEALRGNPDVHRAIPIPKRIRVLRFLGLVARTMLRYDLSIATNGGDRRVMLMRTAARRTLALFRRGTPTAWWQKRLVSGWIERDPTIHTTQLNLQFADIVGAERVYGVIAPMSPEAPAELDAAATFDWRTEPFAVLHVTTNANRKRWTVDGWAAVAQNLRDRGWRCVFTGGPGDDEDYVATVLATAGPDAVNLRGAISMAATRALIEAARVYVGVDTSTAHIAGAVGTPTLTIFGPGSPTLFAPWPKGHASEAPPFPDTPGSSRCANVAVVRGDCPCKLDYRNGCGKSMPGRSRCLEELPPGTVIAALDDLLA